MINNIIYEMKARKEELESMLDVDEPLMWATSTITKEEAERQYNKLKQAIEILEK